MLTKGKYGGVGIQIGKRDNILTVISPMENSPAKRAGILAGDRVMKIDESETDNLSMDAAAKLIRGERGTNVILTIERFGENELIEYTLTREDIKVNDVFYYGLIDGQTGYIRLSRFSKNSDKELKKEYLNDFKKRLKYPKAGREYRAAVARGEVLSNPQLTKKYKLGAVSYTHLRAHET